MLATSKVGSTSSSNRVTMPSTPSETTRRRSPGGRGARSAARRPADQVQRPRRRPRAAGCGHPSRRAGGDGAGDRDVRQRRQVGQRPPCPGQVGGELAVPHPGADRHRPLAGSTSMPAGTASSCTSSPSLSGSAVKECRDPSARMRSLPATSALQLLEGRRAVDPRGAVGALPAQLVSTQPDATFADRSAARRPTVDDVGELAEPRQGPRGEQVLAPSGATARLSFHRERPAIAPLAPLATAVSTWR